MKQKQLSKKEPSAQQLFDQLFCDYLDFRTAVADLLKDVPHDWRDFSEDDELRLTVKFEDLEKVMSDFSQALHKSTYTLRK